MKHRETDIDQANARIERLLKVLRPFANYAEAVEALKAEHGEKAGAHIGEVAVPGYEECLDALREVNGAGDGDEAGDKKPLPM
jgi:hypothetical protein